MSEQLPAETRFNAFDAFPELKDFEVELESNDGKSWSSFRENEDVRVASVLRVRDAVIYMLSGGVAAVEDPEGNRTRCRLTPKAWLEKST